MICDAQAAAACSANVALAWHYDAARLSQGNTMDGVFDGGVHVVTVLHPKPQGGRAGIKVAVAVRSCHERLNHCHKREIGLRAQGVVCNLLISRVDQVVDHASKTCTDKSMHWALLRTADWT
eukprot:365910-Chlamydomonas_euryale.AAC.12